MGVLLRGTRLRLRISNLVSGFDLTLKRCGRVASDLEEGLRCHCFLRDDRVQKFEGRLRNMSRVLRIYGQLPIRYGEHYEDSVSVD